MLATDFVSGVAVGLVGGLTSGLLGVSPGGGLVVFSVLLLGAEQHVAQGVSLAAQVPPTSLAGIRQYWEKGHRAPLVWLLLIGAGFLIGGVAGAKVAGAASRVNIGDFLIKNYSYSLANVQDREAYLNSLEPATDKQRAAKADAS